VNAAAAGTRGREVFRGTVLADWIDLNDHMNVAYYVLAFDHGVDALWEQFGITTDYVETRRMSTFAVESHITYQRELREGDEYIVTSDVLAYDEKRLHQFMRMYHAVEGYLAATSEWMNLHVSLDTRRVAPWPPDILAGIARWVGGQGGSLAAEAGSRMVVPRPLWSIEGYT
jgi:acyl-CoA thioester hydrolase